jgi:hypothetical protein
MKGIYMINNLNKVILTDCDGGLMNWEYAFHTWMQHRGYTPVPGNENDYDMGDRYGLDNTTKQQVVRNFNESAAIGFLPPLRDAMYYVDLLHRKHGYTFHMITSLSKDESAQALRIANTKKLFGDTAFTKFIFADTGEDKDEVLAPYIDSGLFWIEDKVENAELGVKYGLESLLIEHGHNMDCADIALMKNWKEVYDFITG